MYSPLRTYITRPGCTVGVLGIGGLGHLAVQYASKMGAQVGGVWSPSPQGPCMAAEAEGVNCKLELMP